MPAAGEVASAAAALGLAPSQAECAELAALVAAAALSETGRRIAAARPIGREYPFAFSLTAGDPLLSGVIDMLAEENGGGLLLVDYKSDRVHGGDDLEARVERDYGVQRRLYALAALRSGARQVEVVHWFLERPGEPAAAVYTSAAISELEAGLAELTERALAGTYEVSPRPHRALCETCPGRRSLCSWSEQETLRSDPGDEPESPREDTETPLTLF